jgi:primosomal protein N' (replication factor Y)
MQVAGRAGRAELKGEVLIQTQYPDHPLFAAVVAHDYPGFAGEQLKEREQAASRPMPSRPCCAPKRRRWPTPSPS